MTVAYTWDVFSSLDGFGAAGGNWTGAMQRWCASQPDLVPFRGVCEVHRAQIIQMRGDWSEALEIARIIASGQPRSTAAAAIGPAHYRLAGIFRLRGDYARAEEAYPREPQRLPTGARPGADAHGAGPG